MPAENLVMSIAAGKTILRKLLLSGELAGSAFTRDVRAPEASGLGPYSWVGSIYTPRSSSNYYKAIKGGLSYQGGFYTIGLGYERIDPEYQTLGAYFFNNDLENMTINTTTALFKGKVSLGMNVGLQRNDLDQEKISNMKRMVGSANVSYAASERLNLNASYSNFQTFTNIRPQFEQLTQLTPYDNLDTLNFTQISQTANLSTNYVISTDKERRKNLSINLSFQDAADKQSTGSSHAGTQFYNLNAAYSSSLAPQQMTMTGALNYTHNQMDTISSIAIGPTAALSRSFLEKKLRANLSATVNNSYHDSRLQSRIYSLRAGGRYTIQKKHNLNLSTVGLHRNSLRAEGMQAFLEFTATLGYSFNF